MKKVLAGLVTVAVLAVPTVAVGGVDFENVVKASSFYNFAKLESSKGKEEVKITNKNTEVAKVDSVEAKENEIIVTTVANTEVHATVNQEVAPSVQAPANVVTTTQVKEVVTSQASTTSVATTTEVITTSNVPVTTQEEKEEVVLGPNDLFGIVGPVDGVTTEEEKQEFQAKWDAMMAERTASEEEQRLVKLSEHNE